MLMGLYQDVQNKMNLLQNDRLKICKECKYNNNGMCMDCLCVIKLKVKIKSTSCPQGKW